MLQGHIEVRHNLRLTGQDFQQLVGHAAGIEVQAAHPEIALNGAQIAQQLGQAVFLAQVASIIGQILRDQVQLSHALVEQIARFLQQDGRRDGLVLALHERDAAEGAGVVAAVGNLQECVWRLLDTLALQVAVNLHHRRGPVRILLSSLASSTIFASCSN